MSIMTVTTRISRKWLERKPKHELATIILANLDRIDLFAEPVDGSAIVQAACALADWQQVVLNGGPPCFHLEGGRFCFRAKRWEGHDDLHRFVSLLDFYSGSHA